MADLAPRHLFASVATFSPPSVERATPLLREGWALLGPARTPVPDQRQWLDGPLAHLWSAR